MQGKGGGKSVRAAENNWLMMPYLYTCVKQPLCILLQCDVNHDGKISMEELAGLLTFWMIRCGLLWMEAKGLGGAASE